MTYLQWTLTAVASGAIVAALAALVWSVRAMLTGRPTVSGYLKRAPRWVVSAVSFAAGLIVGVCFSHWWFPTVGD